MTPTTPDSRASFYLLLYAQLYAQLYLLLCLLLYRRGLHAAA
jgi:hypothetical protein